MTNIKVFEKIGKNPGKNIIILAGVHGNESFGVRMLERVIPKLDIISGKVTFIFANLEAIKQDKRFVEYNLNRCFLKEQPEEMAISLEGKTAKEIMSYLEEADIMLDLHASNNPDSVPFIICMPQSIDFVRILPFEIVSYNWDEFEPGSTDYYMNLQNKVGICVECGYVKDSSNEIFGENALRNFLVKAGAIKGDIVDTKEQSYYKIIDLYKNEKGKFRTSRGFADWEKLEDTTLIGLDGDEEVFAEKDELMLFVRDKEELYGECFLKAKKVSEETLLNSNKLEDISREVEK